MPYAVIAALFAIVLTLHRPHIPTPNTIDWYATDQKVTIEGIIVDEPDRRPMQTKYTIDSNQLTDGSGTILDGIHGRVLVTDRTQWPLFEYGDRVTVSGTLEKPEKIETFHYDRYLSRYDIYAVMYRGSIQPIPSPSPNPSFRIRRALYSLKESFESHINRLLPEPHASFMAGLLTGSRKGIPVDLMNAFNRTGLTHIIAISGYNITIVIAIIGSLLCWLPVRIRFYPATLAIIIFTIFVGASAAVIRAAIMGILGLIALQCGRVVHMRLTILWTALFMVAWNPKILWHDAGFQLSFLAVIGLTELSPLMERFVKRLPRTLAIRESLQMTIAAQIAATPLIIILFGRFSLIAPMANLLVVPVIPFAMLFGAFSTLVSYVSFPLGQMIAYIAWASLEWIVQVAMIGSSIPFASFDINLPVWIVILYYACLIFTIYKATNPSPPAAKVPSST